MATSKKSYHHGNLEEALLTSGIEEARRSGSQNLGVTHLAKRVNVSPMAVYRHFSNGESLRASISQQAREELARYMLSELEGKTGVKNRFLAVGRAYVKFGLNEPGLFSVAFLDCGARPNREDNPSAWMIFYDRILDLCNEGIIDASEVEAVAALAWSSVHGFAVLAGGENPSIAGSSESEVEELLERTWAGVIHTRSREIPL